MNEAQAKIFDEVLNTFLEDGYDIETAEQAAYDYVNDLSDIKLKEKIDDLLKRGVKVQ